jgi:acetyltransferase EpsM
MNKKVIIVGSGSHAAELRDYINHNNFARPLNRFNVVGYIDDDDQKSYKHYDFTEPFLGQIKDHIVDKDCEYLMGIANLDYKKAIIEKLEKQGAKFTGLIHPTAIISETAEIHSTTVISHNASVGANSKIGKFNLLNSRCTIGHDTKVGDFNFISPQAAISGYTQIGDDNVIGTNACTVPGVKIGNRNKITAGMVIFKNISDDNTILFRYKEKLTIIKEK